MEQHPWHGALVTGASSGIGAALVRQLSAAGVDTVAVARRQDRLEALANECPGVEVLVADLGTAAGLDRVGQRLRDPKRPIDLLVNNAGFGTSGQFVELPLDRLLGELRLNIEALVTLCHQALPGMVARRRGWVLNVSSVAAFQAAPGLANYAATKAFVTSFSEALHEEARPHGVHVTVLCPGLTATEFQGVSNISNTPSSFPASAWLTAEEVARTGLRDLARAKAVSVPGLQYKALVTASSVVPRSITRRVARIVRKASQR
ncbi:MAG: short-chain dehydrogenase/reductase [Acidimicrobiia bacterium]|nr:short-chain dehydrogenase/reductase [Acidimicrobiia bacterium]